MNAVLVWRKHLLNIVKSVLVTLKSTECCCKRVGVDLSYLHMVVIKHVIEDNVVAEDDRHDDRGMIMFYEDEHTTSMVC